MTGFESRAQRGQVLTRPPPDQHPDGPDVIIAETGADMALFPTAKHLASMSLPGEYIAVKRRYRLSIDSC